MSLKVSIEPALAPLRGRLRVPGDKSIAHRAVLFNGFAEGQAQVAGLPSGEDVRSSIGAIVALGARVTEIPEGIVITGFGKRPQSATLDCGNSGTTIRLLMGLLAGCEGSFELDGDASLRRRPMERVAGPLREMGAWIATKDGGAPIQIQGRKLLAFDHKMKVASAQLKTALLLAGLQASGSTTVQEPLLSRDHSERMLRAMGVQLSDAANTLTVQGPQRLQAVDVAVPGDPSSAAFFCVAAATVPGSEVVIEDVCLNPTRTGFIDVLRRMGADLRVRETGTSGGERVGSLEARYSKRLQPFVIEADEVPATIDELPVLAVAAASAQGRSRLRGAAELRVKESDRIRQVATLVRAMGAKVEEFPDGMDIEGVVPAGGQCVDADADHRLAMSAAIAALACRQPLAITDAGAAAVSFPEFFECLEALRT